MKVEKYFLPQLLIEIYMTNQPQLCPSIKSLSSA